MADALKEVEPVKLSPHDRELVMRKIIETCRREGYIVVEKGNAQEFIGIWLHSNFPKNMLTVAQCAQLSADLVKKMGVI